MVEPGAHAAWLKMVERQIQAFRSLPRAPGRPLLNQDELESFYESQEEPEELGGRPSWERRVRV